MIFDYSNIVINSDTNLEMASIPVPPNFPIKNGFFLHEITPREQYRADTIAYNYYGDATKTWVIDKMNNFKHGFKEYTVGRKIKILRPELLSEMGIE